ncbi:MAG TPA: RuvX/YqgF family protein [Candidatus Gracilibacteria bacterium]|mgnify:FL=1|nr:RuvX/YqgF family protein [Candidatus Gracilibacteria bacterium]
MKVLAVDYGIKRVGLASGDDVSKVVFPKGVIFRKSDEQVVEDLLKICEDFGYGKVVFGMPINDEGKNKQAEIVDNFIAKFKIILEEDFGEGRELVLEIDTIDESFSSFEADGYLSDFSGKKIRIQEGDRDSMAAKVILERYFAEN